jgi:hypothetical protein
MPTLPQRVRRARSGRLAFGSAASGTRRDILTRSVAV